MKSGFWYILKYKPIPVSYTHLDVYKRQRYKETVTSENATAKKPEVKRVLSDQPLHINRQLDAVVDTIALRNKSIRFAAGFRIQIYVGNTRKEADDARLYSYQT